MAEWSKAVDSSSILSGGVGSNPTPSSNLLHVLNFYAAARFSETGAKPVMWAIGLVV